MKRLVLVYLCALTSMNASFAPRMIGSAATGYTYSAHTTFLAGYSNWLEFRPTWSVPITCDPSTLTCRTDGSYLPTGTELNAGIVADGAQGQIPGYQFGTYTSTTNSSNTVIQLVSGAMFTPAMVGQQINLGSSDAEYGLHPADTNYYTVLSYVSPTQIVVNRFTVPDQTNAPYWYGGLWGMYGYRTATYDVCNVSGTAFQLKQHANPPCTGAVQPFVSSGSNVFLTFEPGNGLFIQPTISGLPAGSTLTWWNGCGYQSTNPAAGDYLFIRHLPGGDPYSTVDVAINIPATAAPGQYTLGVTMSANKDGTGASSTKTFTVNVAALPKLRNTPKTLPALPGLSNWLTDQTGYTHGTLDYYCNKATGALQNVNTGCMSLGLGCESAIWYPDGALTYQFASSYLKDAGYQSCALSISNWYAGAVNSVAWSSAAGMQFQEVFGWGLYQSWRATRNPAYLQAVVNMATGAPAGRPYPIQAAQLGWGTLGGNVQREYALGLDLLTAYQQMTGLPYQYPGDSVDRYARLKDILINQAFMLADAPCDGCALGDQPFYLTYAAHAFRHIDDIAHDDRILYAAKRLADWAMGVYDINTTHAAIYNTGNLAACSAGLDVAGYRFGPGNTWFNQDLDGACQLATGTPIYAVNGLNMFATLWSYVWRNTGIDIYRQYAYDAFAHGLDTVDFNAVTDCCVTGKQTNQLFGFQGLTDVISDAAGTSSGAKPGVRH